MINECLINELDIHVFNFENLSFPVVFSPQKRLADYCFRNNGVKCQNYHCLSSKNDDILHIIINKGFTLIMTLKHF